MSQGLSDLSCDPQVGSHSWGELRSEARFNENRRQMTDASAEGKRGLRLLCLWLSVIGSFRLTVKYNRTFPQHIQNTFTRTHTPYYRKKVAQVNNKQSPNHQNIQHSIFHEYINKVTIYVMIFTLLLLGSLGYFLHVHTLNTRHSLAGLASGTGIKYILLYRRNIMLVMN